MTDPKAAKHNCRGVCQEGGCQMLTERILASLAPLGRVAAAGVELSL